MTGGTLFVSVAQCVFNNLLLLNIKTGVSKVLVLQTGASDIQQTFRGEQLDDVLNAYMEGLRGIFILGLALACAAVASSLLPPKRSVKNAKFTGVGAAG